MGVVDIHSSISQALAHARYSSSYVTGLSSCLHPSCALEVIQEAVGYLQAQLDGLEQQIQQTQSKLTQTRKRYRDLQKHQRTLVLGTLQVSNEMMSVGRSAVQAAELTAEHSRKNDKLAREGQMNVENRVRLAKKFTLFDSHFVPPRPLNSFRHFASIRYSDLHEVLKCRSEQTSEGSGVACADGVSPNSNSETPSFSDPRSGDGPRVQQQYNVAIDTVSGNVSLRELVLDYLHQTAAQLSVPESDVCWFVDTGHAISPTSNLAYSSSLSSRECIASALLNYVATTCEHALHVQFGELLTSPADCPTPCVSFLFSPTCDSHVS
jgi:TolA-binding protein